MTYKAFNYIERKKWAKRQQRLAYWKGAVLGGLVVLALLGVAGWNEYATTVGIYAR